MIREFRRAESARLYALLRENFPAEEALYGTRPESWDRIVRRIYRADTRIVLGLLRLVGRPVYRFFVVEADGTMVATSLVSFAARAGYISMVMVDAPYRGRGYARRLLARCAAATRAVGRPYIALDVLRDNAPAIALYRSEGFLPLREMGFYSLPLDPPPAPARAAPAGASVIRPFRSTDHTPLWNGAAAAIPPRVAEVLPLPRRALSGAFNLGRILSSRSETWVLEERGAPVGWLSATVSDVMEASGLAAPIVLEGASPEGVRALVGTAIEWARAQGAPRMVSEVSADNLRAVAALEGAGFAVAHRVQTLYRPVAPVSS